MGMKGAVVVGNAATGKRLAVEPDYGEWFAETENYAATLDATGQDVVRIAVGAPGNGGAHDVSDPDHGIDSGLREEVGSVYSLTFDGNGVSKYRCTSGPASAMRGAIVVGDPTAGTITVPEDALIVGGGLGAAALSPVAFAVALKVLGTDERPPETEERTERGDGN
ncbi:Plastocyanin [Halopelagius longus]|nr:Plastocyanin [Halopelagius longus]